MPSSRPATLAGDSSAPSSRPATLAGDSALEVKGLTRRFGSTLALDDVSLAVPAGSVTSLLGPSGCGKTTLLRTVAGLEVPDAGQVVVGGSVLTDGSAVVAPERRRVGMVFQDGALFPHLTVAANVGYGLPRRERSGPRVAEALELVGLGGFGGRRPHTLSGGQRQRVAIARALAPRPALLLLDEPFSNLDAALRVAVRGEVHALLLDLGVTCLFVTHDQDEAFVLGDSVAVMHDGRIAQHGAPQDVYDRPADAWVAGFVGDANLVPGRVADGSAATVLGRVPVHPGGPASGPCTVVLRPEQLRLRDPGNGNGTGGMAGTVRRVEAHGHDCLVFVELPDGTDLRVRVPGAARWRRGDAVDVGVGTEPAATFFAPGGPLP